ncbi:MAG: hypothetical protein U1F34_07075 [Gammaproteobacteria bacterium]
MLSLACRRITRTARHIKAENRGVGKLRRWASSSTVKLPAHRRGGVTEYCPVGEDTFRGLKVIEPLSLATARRCWLAEPVFMSTSVTVPAHRSRNRLQ